MSRAEQDPPALYRALEAFFWLLLLAGQLPAAGVLWLLGQLLRLSGPFGAFVADLVRWRGRP
jgi:hypothetical protein